MNKIIHFAFHAWLLTSDSNYLEGRVLWFNQLLVGSCVLLWLAIEQIIKLLILQKDIELINHDSIDLTLLHNIIDNKAKNISPRHKVSELMDNFILIYPNIDLAQYYNTMNKLEEYFQRRYVRHKDSSIHLDMIHSVDELYFLLRNNVDRLIPMSLIDQIFMYNKHKWPHPILSYNMAIIDNNSFRPRLHIESNIHGPDNIIYIENGSNEIIIKNID